jgi:hypothetical protein
MVRALPQDLEQLLRELEQNWGSPFIARLDVGRATGGAIHHRTMANYDCEGRGPQGRFLLNGKVVYPLRQFVQWLRTRMRASDQSAGEKRQNNLRSRPLDPERSYLYGTR